MTVHICKTANKMSMIRQYYNQTLQTKPWYCEEEPRSSLQPMLHMSKMKACIGSLQPQFNTTKMAACIRSLQQNFHMTKMTVYIRSLQPKFNMTKMTVCIVTQFETKAPHDKNDSMHSYAVCSQSST